MARPVPSLLLPIKKRVALPHKFVSHPWYTRTVRPPSAYLISCPRSRDHSRSKTVSTVQPDAPYLERYQTPSPHIQRHGGVHLGKVCNRFSGFKVIAILLRYMLGTAKPRRFSVLFLRACGVVMFPWGVRTAVHSLSCYWTSSIMRVRGGSGTYPSWILEVSILTGGH
ncbi:hypothetical protein BDN72DRAFT_210754 [Pluteus cervinus]|uniref:Uncharacterized protein n=1 Tax=Pluteus cervinus TaxID=181527 RepID=A0ACD3B5W9_9AGAR|nr:hypothetical protein BDN72DRAFT_210754 [Pluteus cervinus]